MNYKNVDKEKITNHFFRECEKIKRQTHGATGILALIFDAHGIGIAAKVSREIARKVLLSAFYCLSLDTVADEELILTESLCNFYGIETEKKVRPVERRL